ncbi:MAG: SCP2 sterol-binding domain-containing protein [Candidatus Odinarchaeota archaeon]
MTPETGTPAAEFVVTGDYSTWVKINKGELDSVKALMTRKLKIQGNLAKALRATRATKELNRSARMIENVEFL